MTIRQNQQSEKVSHSPAKPGVIRRMGERWGVLLASILCAGAVTGYAATAAAAWGTCQPYVIYEIGLRNFQVTCNAGGDTLWMMFSTTDSDQANRFQALITSAILAGDYVRADLVTDPSGLCSGVTGTCRKATKWSLSTVASP
jgi:hypothetical protein